MKTKKAALVSLVALMMAACAPGSGSTDDGGSENQKSSRHAIGGAHAHAMPVTPKNAKKIFSAPSGAKLTYRGGPVLSSVKVFTVFFGSGVSFQSDVNKFYTDITKSPYFDWLSEYNTQTQKIGEGSFIGSYVYTSAPGGSLSDDQIQSELTKLIQAGKIPANDANTIYMVHFPPGVSISMGGDSSCVQFCAYHGSFSVNGKSAFYGVLPDLGGACAGGCGGGNQLQNTTSVASHELIEAVTDADVGQNNLAWYDDNYGEIGDICNAQQGTVNGWTIQLEFSNKAGDCIASNGSDPSGGSGGDPSGGVGGSDPSGGGVGGSDPSGGGVGGGCSNGSGGVGGSDPSGGVGGGNPTGGGGTCGHDICAQGDPLDGSCDQCAGFVCDYDDYCCSTAWDDVCVSETSWCGASACQ